MALKAQDTSRQRGRMKTDYQVVVLGGGPAGCATALALLNQGVERILVVESSRYDKVRVGESIPPDSGLLLRRLGVWDDFLAQEHEPCLGSCSSWGSDAVGYNDFLLNPHGNGWHLDRRRFDALLAHCAFRAGADVRIATRFEGCAGDASSGFRLRLRSNKPFTKAASTDRGFEKKSAGPVSETAKRTRAPRQDHGEHEVSARFVVDATGPGARFARAQGADRRHHDRLVCVMGFLQLTEASNFSRLTFLEAVEYGWWYAAKLPGERLAVAVASDRRIIKNIGVADQEGWLSRLNQTRHLSRELSGTGLIPGSLKACTASSSLLVPSAGEGWLAVGDAASTYDPIASQGVHKALADGLQAGRAIASCLGGDQDGMRRYRPGTSRRFADYLSNRDSFYSMEQRWPESDFWRLRRGATSASNPLTGQAPDQADRSETHQPASLRSAAYAQAGAKRPGDGRPENFHDQ
ncbi:MAG TPA: NAD(P)/FAD-dependent oxidoreductase [Acidobacteriota bacterium]|nr:NAD(P)/FAD-dependent oxidoreductase [Acidobacteriota bacterium]